jgi:hypothetical protein
MMVRRWRRIVGAVLLGLSIAASAAAQSPIDDRQHLGVASCASDNCHGAIKPLAGVRVQQDEYLIWLRLDKHSQAYRVLRQPLALRIAKNLGLPDAEHASLCLDCHADNVPKERQGPEFDISDGVGCETCHGAAVDWLGIHVAGVSHAENVKHGMVATEQPTVRAERCLACHVGDDKRFVTHRMMGAGHPPMPFELATFSAWQPPHYAVNDTYIARKGKPNDIKMWAVGLAEDVRRRLDLMLDQKNAQKGVNVELSLFDCQSCHHAMSQLQWQPRASTGLEPGKLKLYDATAVMLRVIAQRIAPDTGRSLGMHLLALHQATGDGWDAVRRQAAAVRQDTEALVATLGAHDFDRADAKALAEAVIAAATEGDNLDHSGAQQEFDALRSIVATMGQFGYADESQLAGLNEALDGLFAVIADDQAYRPDDFVKAMRRFKEKLAL